MMIEQAKHFPVEPLKTLSQILQKPITWQPLMKYKPGPVSCDCPLNPMSYVYQYILDLFIRLSVRHTPGVTDRPLSLWSTHFSC